MIETKEKDICGHTYRVTQFPARRALKIKTKLVKLLAPSLFSAMGSYKGNIMDMNLGSVGFSKAVEALVARLDEDYVINLILSLLESTRRDGKEITPEYFDMEFADNFSELFKALYFVLEVNYQSFFTMISTGNHQHLSETPQEGKTQK